MIKEQNRLEGSKVLITGGAGLIGSHIADQLVLKGVDEVIILDNFTRGRRENLNWAKSCGNVKIIEGDIRDQEMMVESTKFIDYVFHQAAIRITACADFPRGAMEVMDRGTFNVLDAAAHNNVKKVVLASSASVYGMAEEFPTPESHHPYNNETIYGAFKLANEAIARAFHNMYGLEYTALRYFNVYGPRMDIYGAYTEVIIRWLDAIDEWIAPKILGDGSQTMDFVYVGDVARANILAMEASNVNIAINIGSGKETSLKELLDTILLLSKTSVEPEYLPERKVNPVQRRLADIRRAEQLLGFKAETSLRDGLEELIKWRAAAKEKAPKLIMK
ncbi:MAG: NAD-dependent epimerase/dehydratase family protein [candidate division Zixibacteria bacterium]|nr:NAD-dependent epimerase/dehydratase family protein [candidate division Zixibacteria bacterium]